MFSIATACIFAHPACAASLPAGTLVKGSGAAVYAAGGDGNRYAFPNERVFKSWFADFSSVKRIADSDLAALPLAGNVTYKPGARLVKLTTDPKVYAVGLQKILRWVKTEAAARDIYGNAWAKQVDDVSDAFFGDYEIGTPIVSATDYDPAWGVYAQASLAAATGGNSSDDPSRLPRDMPRYPAAGFSAIRMSPTGDAAAELLTADGVEAVRRWYEAMAPKLGWVQRETLAQSVLGTGDNLLALAFRKTDGGATYDLTVTMLEAGTVTLYRTPTKPETDFERFPAVVPIYRSGEILYAKANAASSTAEYFALTDRAPNGVVSMLAPDLMSGSWVLVAVKDAGTALIRKYERVVGHDLMRLLFIIGNVQGVERDATAVIVRYGPMTTIDAVDLDSLKKLFEK